MARRDIARLRRGQGALVSRRLPAGVGVGRRCGLAALIIWQRVPQGLIPIGSAGTTSTFGRRLDRARAGATARATRSGSSRAPVSHRGRPGTRPWRTAVRSTRRHRGVQPLQFVDRPGRQPSATVDPCPPADFVGEQVPEAGDHRLIHQRRLQPTAPAGQRVAERSQANPHRIGALRARSRRRPRCRRRPAKRRATCVDRCSAVRRGPATSPAARGPSRSVPVGGVVRVAGHSAVDQQRRAVGRQDQPFTVSARVAEAMAGQRRPSVCAVVLRRMPGS